MIDSALELECLRIPHFYSAFYVYKYATGLSAAVALAGQVLETGDATRYLGFLKSGGSEFPIPTLQKAGSTCRARRRWRRRCNSSRAASGSWKRSWAR